MTLSKNSGAEPIPINPFICFEKNLNWFVDIQEPILEPINIKSFFLTNFLIANLVSLVHLLIFPLVNSPDDFPCPEYSTAKNPILFFLQKLKKVLGFSPSTSDINPCRKTT